MQVKTISVIFALFAWVMNPAFVMGCGAEQPDFTFGEEDMLALLESVNGQSWPLTHADGDLELIFALHQTDSVYFTGLFSPGLLEAARACGNREFVTSASACVDQTLLGLAGTVSVRDALTGEQVVSPIELKGAMEVVGLNLTHVTIRMAHDAGEFVLNTVADLSFSLTEASW